MAKDEMYHIIDESRDGKYFTVLSGNVIKNLMEGLISCKEVVFIATVERSVQDRGHFFVSRDYLMKILDVSEEEISDMSKRLCDDGYITEDQIKYLMSDGESSGKSN